MINRIRLLGIDYGDSKIGVACATSPLADPLVVIRYQSMEYVVKKIREEVEKFQIEKIIVGISEGEMGKKSHDFGEMLKKELKTDVEYQDETLTSWEANELSMQSNMARKKRREMEDAYAAALMLQAYIDNL